MNTIIRELTEREIIEIYNQYLEKHFPPEEVKPLKSILRMYRNGEYWAYGMFGILNEKNSDKNLQCEESLVGYAFVSGVKDAELKLLDYFAILSQYRSLGAGTEFLEKLSQVMGCGIIIETEDINYAENDMQREERTRRDRFYLNSGVRPTGITGVVYGVHYAVWVKGDDISDEKCLEDYKKIYMNMIQGDKFEKFVSFQRK